MSSQHLHPLIEAMKRFDEVWADAGSATELSRRRLIETNEALSLLRRRMDGIHAEVVAVIAQESRPELGPESLAKQHGFRSPATLIAATTGGSTGDAARLVKSGRGDGSPHEPAR